MNHAPHSLPGRAQPPLPRGEGWGEGGPLEHLSPQLRRCRRTKPLYFLLAFILFALTTSLRAQTAPFRYAPATAYHILEQTTTDESGYFSLCEGRNGKIYVGTTAYGRNSYLVEFDPTNNQQRIVIDSHQLAGLPLEPTGYASQAKIHTRNYTGPSGVIYVGTKQGYRLSKEDTSLYPGGYVFTYDPATDKAENLGQPMPWSDALKAKGYTEGEGVIDVVADEPRGIIYVVTCEHQHWMRYDRATKQYREIGPMLIPYAATVVDSRGRAHAITKQFELATYDPATDKAIVRPLSSPGVASLLLPGNGSIPIWRVDAEGRYAWLIRMNEPTLLRIDLLSDAATVEAAPMGAMVSGKHPDSRSGMDIGPDGSIYTIIRVNNDTGFGAGYLHKLSRYDPKTNRVEDLGVVAVKNKEFFNFEAAKAAGKKWIHGYHTLPDGTLTILHAHMGLTVGRDGTVWATVLYPYTLLRFDPAPKKSAANQYFDFALQSCDNTERQMAEITRVAEIVAERHINGGLIGFPRAAWYKGHGFEEELWGRSGGLVHISFERPWTKDRTDAQKANDVLLAGWSRDPDAGDLQMLQKFKDRGCYIVGFGPRSLPTLSEHVALCDAWFDTAYGADDRAILLSNDEYAGRGNLLSDVINGWAFMGEFVAACTRRGKMPTMAKSFSYEDGLAWWEKYFQKMQFHDDVTIAPIQPGVLGRAYVTRMRELIHRFERTQMPAVNKTVGLIVDEKGQGRKTIVAAMGHMPWAVVARDEAQAWAVGSASGLHHNLQGEVDIFNKNAPEGALVLRLGYSGHAKEDDAIFRAKKARVMLVAGENPRPDWKLPDDLLTHIDMGWQFGDACVEIPGYPIRILPPSGVMQIVAYEAINTEVLARLSLIRGEAQ